MGSQAVSESMGVHAGLSSEQYHEQRAFMVAFNHMISLGLEAGYLTVDQNTVTLMPMHSPVFLNTPKQVQPLSQPE